MIDKRPWNCSVCEKYFAKFSHLTKHMEDHHQFEESAVDNGSKQNSKDTKSQGSKYKCKVCQGVFADNNLLVTHSCAGRPGPKIYKCKTCPKEFLYICKLVQHERIHVMDKPYKCVVCYCSFSHACHLGRHMQTHSASANTKCIVCSKVFKTSALLQQHKLIHNTEKVFKCDLCPHTFTDLSQLTIHLNEHVHDQKVSFEESTKSSMLETLETKSRPEPRSFKTAKRKTAGSDRKWNFRSCRARSSSVKSRRWGKKRGNIFKMAQENLRVSSDCQKVEKLVVESGSEAKSSLETAFVCDICQQGFISSSLYELHVKNEHQEKKILPNGINGPFMSRPSLFEQFESLSSPETAVFTKVSSQSGMSHLTSTPKQAIFLLNPEKSLTFTNPGEDTGMTDFTAQPKRCLDGNLRCLDGNFRCLICDQNFANPLTLDLHLEKHIIVKTLPRNRHTTWSIHFPQKKFCCKICRKSFSQRTILQGHSRIMHHALNKRPIE